MEKENNVMLKKVINCLYIIIFLVAVNTVMLFVVNSSLKDETTTSNPSTSDYDVSMFETVDPEDLIEYFAKKGTYVLYMGSSTCTYCKQFLPTLQQTQDEYGYKTLYLPVDQTSSATDAFEEFISKLDMEYTDGTTVGEFGEFYGYTPTIVIFKDGKQVAGEIGAMSYDSFTALLEDSGLSKK